MLVAEGAEQFAVDLGFPRENLLTDDARKIWLLWKENNSQMDWWGPSMPIPAGKIPSPTRRPPNPPSICMAFFAPSRLHSPSTPTRNGLRPSAPAPKS